MKTMKGTNMNRQTAEPYKKPPKECLGVINESLAFFAS